MICRRSDVFLTHLRLRGGAVLLQNRDFRQLGHVHRACAFVPAQRPSGAVTYAHNLKWGS